MWQKQTKILCGQLNCSVKLADVSTRCSSHPQGKKQTKILCGQLNCSVKLANVSTRCSFALRMTRASSRNVSKFYWTVKLSTKNLRLFHEDSNWERCHFNHRVAHFRYTNLESSGRWWHCSVCQLHHSYTTQHSQTLAACSWPGSSPVKINKVPYISIILLHTYMYSVHHTKGSKSLLLK